MATLRRARELKEGRGGEPAGVAEGSGCPKKVGGEAELKSLELAFS